MSNQSPIEVLCTILQCPVTGEWLRPVVDSDLQTLYTAKQLDLKQPLLISLSGRCVWQVVNGIVDLRADRGVLLYPETPADPANHEADAVSDNVRGWYDNFGWQRSDSGLLNDSAFYSHESTSVYGLYESLSHFAQVERFTGGRFLLDAASGAIAHPEYLAYSWNHQFRVCVDFSISALQEAARKLDNHGLFVLADVCRLPFRDDVFDGVISGYTVQHIHRDQQAAAVKELYRVLSPGHRLCLMATQETGWQHRALLRGLRFLSWCLGWRRSADPQPPRTSDAPVVVPPYQLYGHIWPSQWWKELARSLSEIHSLQCLRSLSKDEFDSVVTTRFGVRCLRGLEMVFSRLLATSSTLTSLEICKPQIATTDGTH